jgi:integrase
MARTIKETRLDSRTARRNLTSQREPYWRLISTGAHIGYRRNKAGQGSWIARMRQEDGKYIFEKVGVADDIEDADGIRILSFGQAQEMCRKWFHKIAQEQSGEHYGPYTVDDAIADYLAWFEINRKSHDKTKFMIEAFIRPAFGNMRVDRLTSTQIKTWFEQLSLLPPRKRVKKGASPQYHLMEKDQESLRRRKASVNRYLNVLKAILNKAFQDGKVHTDHAWRRVKPFKNVNSPRVEYFELAELMRLINACPSDLKNLVRAAVYTGCRYAEISRMTTADYNSSAGQIHVRISKSGKSRFVTLSDEGIEFFNRSSLGKKNSDLLFTRSDGSAWGTSYQQRPFREALKNSGITKDVNFHSLRHTHASLLAMNGVELPIIARQLGHSDTRMVEQHYAHLSPSYVSGRIKEGLPKFGLNSPETIRSFERKAIK